jgi:tetratricopeptide (TPR) repeat protein
MRFVMCGALAIVLTVVPSIAQRGSLPPSETMTGPNSSNANPEVPSADDVLNGHLWSPEEIPLTGMPFDTHWMLAAETCNSWTESASHSPTVSVARLAVPGKASGEYQKGCGALKDKKLDEAEKHERAAVKLYPDYAAAWVVLGQILEAEDKRDDGRQACSQARSVDPDYVAPYLCLADFATTEDNWQEVSMLAGSALTLDPAGNAYSFYYAADAAFHLGNLAKAEKDAQNSITLDKWRHLAQVHLLLAQIYKAKNNFVAQAAQLREYLKIAPNAADSTEVKSVLAQLQAKVTP